MIVIVLGKPGSGKGTQSKFLASKFGLFYFSSGDFARKLARKDPKIDDIINKKGELIPQGIMTAYISKYLDKKLKDNPNILLDGYPRFVEQYRYLKKFLRERGLKINAAILLRVSDETVVTRLSARRMDEKTGKIYNLVTNPPPSSLPKGQLIQRTDDEEGAIKERLAEFERNTRPMIEEMRKEGDLLEVDGEKPITEIETELARIINERKG